MAMAEPEFRATGVRIEKWLRSLTRAGQVRIRTAGSQLLTSYGREIDSAPVQAVRASRPWFAGRRQRGRDVNGKRYRLTMRRARHRPDGRRWRAGSWRRCARPGRPGLTCAAGGVTSAVPARSCRELRDLGHPGSRWSHVTLGLPAITLRSSPPATYSSAADCWIRSSVFFRTSFGESQP